MSALQEMLDAQLELQTVMPPFPSRATSNDAQVACEYIKDMVLACEDELHELLNETGWKPWSSSWHVHIEAARGEWIDAWHFMMNLANRLGMDEQMIVERYAAKHDVNRQRQADGYDGVAGKCPYCHRDIATTKDLESPCAPTEGWCGVYGSVTSSG